MGVGSAAGGERSVSPPVLRRLSIGIAPPAVVGTPASGSSQGSPTVPVAFKTIAEGQGYAPRTPGMRTVSPGGDRSDGITSNAGSMAPAQDYRHRSKGVFADRLGPRFSTAAPSNV